MLSAGLYGHTVPNTVANFVKLVRDGAYKGTVFGKVRSCLQLLPISPQKQPAYFLSGQYLPPMWSPMPRT